MPGSRTVHLISLTLHYNIPIYTNIHQRTDMRGCSGQRERRRRWRGAAPGVEGSADCDQGRRRQLPGQRGRQWRISGRATRKPARRHADPAIRRHCALGPVRHCGWPRHGQGGGGGHTSEATGRSWLSHDRSYAPHAPLRHSAPSRCRCRPPDRAHDALLYGKGWVRKECGEDCEPISCTFRRNAPPERALRPQLTSSDRWTSTPFIHNLYGKPHAVWQPPPTLRHDLPLPVLSRADLAPLIVHT